MLEMLVPGAVVHGRTACACTYTRKDVNLHYCIVHCLYDVFNAFQCIKTRRIGNRLRVRSAAAVKYIIIIERCNVKYIIPRLSLIDSCLSSRRFRTFVPISGLSKALASGNVDNYKDIFIIDYF